MGPANQPRTVSQPVRSERPPWRSQARQIAQGVAVPSVSTQQSPHTGWWQRAHGPTASTPQCLQRAVAPPSSYWARPDILTQLAPLPAPANRGFGRVPLLGPRVSEKLRAMDVSGLFLVGALGCALAGCTPTVRQAVDYRGEEFSPHTPAERLRSVAALPLGFESFGELKASCRIAGLDGPVEAAWLSDVDCSERRLRGALRAKAAEVGAQLLIEERCGSTKATGRSTAPGIRCRARVARLDESSRAERPLDEPRTREEPLGEIADADKAAGYDDPTGSQAWRIEIGYQPSPGAAPRAQRPAELVGELPSVPVSHVRLGLLTSRCARECSVDAVRAALRVAAGRLGASDIAAIECVEHPPGITCVGTAAQPEAEL